MFIICLRRFIYILFETDFNKGIKVSLSEIIQSSIDTRPSRLSIVIGYCLVIVDWTIQLINLLVEYSLWDGTFIVKLLIRWRDYSCMIMLVLESRLLKMLLLLLMYMVVLFFLVHLIGLVFIFFNVIVEVTVPFVVVVINEVLAFLLVMKRGHLAIRLLLWIEMGLVNLRLEHVLLLSWVTNVNLWSIQSILLLLLLMLLLLLSDLLHALFKNKINEELIKSFMSLTSHCIFVNEGFNHNFDMITFKLSFHELKNLFTYHKDFFMKIVRDAFSYSN